MTRRWLILLGVAGALLLLGYFHPDAGLAEPTRVSAAVVRPAEAPVPVAGSQAELLPLERSVAEGDIRNPFGAKSWGVQPQPASVVAAPPPPPPAAPPLPFTFAGSLEAEPGHVIYYLVQGEQSYAVAQGDTFAGQYKLAGLEQGQLVILYLPLGVKQQLPIAADP